MKRYALLLIPWMLICGAGGFGGLVLLAGETVGDALRLTAFAVPIGYVGMLLYVRRTGHP